MLCCGSLEDVAIPSVLGGLGGVNKEVIDRECVRQ